VIFRSVVGKLWITFMVLVAVILLFLSIFLIEYFDGYYFLEESKSLTSLGKKVADILHQYPQRDVAIDTAKEVVDSFQTEMVRAEMDEYGRFLEIENVFSSAELRLIFEGNGQIVRLNNTLYKDFISFNSANDVLALALPLQSSENHQLVGAIILYKTLNELYKTTNDLKKIILLFTGIGIVMTTVFAFFLSTRINAPIRKMQKAALQMAKGDFKTKLDIKSTDEIGDLAKSLNQMSSQLDETVLALSSEKEKLANILKSMGEGVITVNDKREIIVINPAAELMLNSFKSDEVRLPEQLKNILSCVMRDKRNLLSDINVNGRTLAVIMAPLYSGQELKGAVTLLRDVTSEREINKLRRDFLANISHELRTPISMLQGYSEAIIDDIAESPEDKKELAQIIYDESIRMGRLVNDLLDLARIESGNYQLKYTKNDIKGIINKMIRKFISIAHDLEITISAEVEENLKLVECDSDRIEQVFTNLIDNALRHTPKDGRIIIRAKTKSADKLLIEVEDSGLGIPEDDLPFVFERFYKADKARTRSRAGTGLGLSIVKNIVEAHGGTVAVTSKIKHGSTFSFTIPFMVE